MKKKIFLLVFFTILLSLILVGSNMLAYPSSSDVTDLPSWIKVGTYAVYDWIYQSDNFNELVWSWEIVSVSDTIQVLHHLEGNLTVGTETIPSTYMATINATTRGIMNIVSVDKELPQGYGFPLATMFSLWIPENVGIGENVSVIGPYGTSYPFLPFLRLENVGSPLETQECAVIGADIEQDLPETALFWYDTHTNVLVKFYMNWPTMDAENLCLLKKWVPIKEFDFNFGKNNYTVVTSSNSTIGDHNLDQDQKQISINVNGPLGTTGFCKITIPEDLLGGDFSVHFNGALLIEDVDYTRTFNGTHNIFYITYNHSAHLIEITGTYVIPEFPSLTPLLIILLVVTIIGVIYKRKLHKSNNGQG